MITTVVLVVMAISDAVSFALFRHHRKRIMQLESRLAAYDNVTKYVLKKVEEQLENRGAK